MGKTRVCGKTCHNARRDKCRCWCGGLFHGGKRKASREAFAREFEVDRLPTTERAFHETVGQYDLLSGTISSDRWRAAVTAAVTARGASATE